jgi:hypothetical protein
MLTTTLMALVAHMSARAHQKELPLKTRILVRLVGISFLLAGLLSTFSAPASAQSTAMTIDFIAEISDVQDSFHVLKDISSGQTITGTYVYNSTSPDSNPDDPTVGEYWHTTAPFGITVNAGKYTFSTDPNNVQFLVEMVDREFSDAYVLHSYNNIPQPMPGFQATVDRISWQLDDPTGTALSIDALPTDAPDLNAWQSLYGLTIEGHSLSKKNTGVVPYYIRAHVVSVIKR